MYTNFGKVIANKNIFNARRPVLLREALLRTSPLHFEGAEDSLDNRLMGAYQTLRKSELLRHWTQLLETNHPRTSFTEWIAQLSGQFQPVAREEFQKMVSLRQVLPASLVCLEGLTNLMYLTSQAGTVDDWFHGEATNALRRFDMRDASVGNLADLLYYFSKREVLTDADKELLGGVLRQAQRHLDQPADTTVSTNGNNTMAYQECPNGRHSLLEYDVANFIHTKGKGSARLVFFYRVFFPAWALFIRAVLRRANPIIEPVELSPLTEHERLKAFFAPWVKAMQAP